MTAVALGAGAMISAFIPAYSQVLPQSADYVRILPEIVLSIFGIIVMLMEPLLDERTGQRVLGRIAFVGTLAGIAATWFMAQSPLPPSGTWCR